MVVNFARKQRGTACEYWLKCTIKLHVSVLKTMTSCRSPIIPFTDYMHVMLLYIQLLEKLGTFLKFKCRFMILSQTQDLRQFHDPEA